MMLTEVSAAAFLAELRALRDRARTGTEPAASVRVPMREI
jgi:hypothetical protein